MTLSGRTLAATLLHALVLLLLMWRGSGAITRNWAFVALNHRPAIFSAADPAALAPIEQQLLTSLDRQPDQTSTRRMLALVQRAQGQASRAYMTPGDLLWWGQQKERAGELPAAAYLYQWAADLDPELGDAWFALGRAHQARQQWPAARSAYDRATAAARWQAGAPSDAHLALGDLYRTAWPGDRPAEARASYEQALSLNAFSQPAWRAAAHYGLGELMLWDLANPAAAVPHYRATLAITPADHWARLRLGIALYRATGDPAAAEREILTAIEQWPDEKHLQWPYFYLGEMYQTAGQSAAAIAAYEQALVLDPANQRLRERIATLRSP